MKTTAFLFIFTCFVGLALASHGTVDAKWKSGNSSESAKFSKAFPCPLEEDIFPCVCTYDSATQELLLVCSAVNNETELKAVFTAPFPDTAFTELRIENNAGLAILGDVFGDVTFERVYLIGVEQLNFITEASLFGSRHTLQIFEIWRTQLTTYTVPIMTLGLYPNLHRFAFSGDYRKVSFPILESNYLTYVDILRWDITSIPVDAFHGVPNVSVIGAHLLGLHEVIPGTFDELQHLAYINLDFNNIARLLPGTLTVTNLTSKINLHDNVITTVDVGAFVVEDGAGSTVAADVYFNNNLLTSLDSDVWQDLLQVIGYLDLRGNPLTCGCDLAWLVLAPDLMAKVHPDSTCYDGTLLHDLDPVIFGDLCLPAKKLRS